MAGINVEFELNEGHNATEALSTIESRLKQNSSIVSATPEVQDERRIVVGEAIVIIGATIVLLKKSREGIEEVKSLLRSLKELVREARGLREAFIDVGPERKALSEITDRDVERIAAGIQE